jgi:hypothetical protein
MSINGPITPRGPVESIDEETLDGIDEQVDAVADEHIGDRLSQLLARASLIQMIGLDGADVLDDAETSDRVGPASPTTPADACALLRRAQAKLAAVEEALHGARLRRDALIASVIRAEARIAEADRQVAASIDGAAAYLDTALERGQEIIDKAHQTAHQIIAEAERRARDILAGAEHHVAGRGR